MPIEKERGFCYNISVRKNFILTLVILTESKEKINRQLHDFNSCFLWELNKNEAGDFNSFTKRRVSILIY